jgi:FixJ family two-component response regulator
MYMQGADLFLSKPITFAALKEMIKSVCSIDFKRNYKRATKENFHVRTAE